MIIQLDLAKISVTNLRGEDTFMVEINEKLETFETPAYTQPQFTHWLSFELISAQGADQQTFQNRPKLIQRLNLPMEFTT